MSLPKEMKCLVKEEEAKGYCLVSRPVPQPGPGDLLIRVDKVSICGSDISLWNWDELCKIFVSLPFTPGHEVTGEVVAVGSDVTEVNLGQRIAVENHFFCGDCFQCKDGRGDICQKMAQYGCGMGTIHGGCSQYSLVPARYCFVLTRNLTSNQAVLLEPMGVAHNAIESMDVKGEDVLVLGCGPIGLFAISIAKTLGARLVYGVDILDSRLDLAKTMGADVVINGAKEDVGAEVMRLTKGNGAGRILEASGVASVLNQSFKWLRKGGQMVVAGLPKAPLHVDNVLTDIVFKSLTLKSVHGRRIFHTWRECERLLAENLVDAGPVISHQLPMSHYDQAFAQLLAGNACKIILDPQL